MSGASESKVSPLRRQFVSAISGEVKSQIANYQSTPCRIHYPYASTNDVPK